MFFGRSATAGASAAAVAMVLLLSLFAELVYAPPRGVRATGLPSIPRDNDEVLPNFVVKPIDDLYFNWEMGHDKEGNDYLQGTFNYTEDLYVAIGIKSVKRMRGPIIMCRSNTSKGITEVSCFDWMGLDYDIQKTQDDTETISGAVVGGVSSITFRRRVRDVQTNVSLIAWNEFHRVIFAKGKWYDNMEMPKQHESDWVGARLINFNTGEVKQLTSFQHRKVMYAAAAFFVVFILAVYTSRKLQMQLSDKTRSNVAVLAVVICVGLLGAYIFANYVDYKVMVKGKAYFRCLGDGAAACFSALLLPIGRRILFSDILSVSPERAVRYHMVAGLLLFLCTAVHGLGMWYKYGTERITRWRDKDEISKLPGLFAFIFMIPVVVGAMLRNRYKNSFRVFRATHYCYLLVVFFACCHYPKLSYGLAPGTALLFLSFLYNRLMFPPEDTDAIDAMTYDEASRCIIVDIVRSDFVSPGSWFELCFPEISRFEYHPFSMARMLKRGDTRLFRFIIQDVSWRLTAEEKKALKNGNSSASGGGGKKKKDKKKTSDGSTTEKKKGTKTNKVARTAKEDPTGLKEVLQNAGTSWTSRLFEMVRAGISPTRYLLDGPHGDLECPPGMYENYLFVAGGVGISTIAIFLQQFANRSEITFGNLRSKRTCFLLWVVPNMALLHVIGNDLVAYADAIAAHSPAVQVVFKIFVTNSRPIELLPTAGNDGGGADDDEDIDAAFTESTAADEDSKPKKDKKGKKDKKKGADAAAAAAAAAEEEEAALLQKAKADKKKKKLQTEERQKERADYLAQRNDVPNAIKGCPFIHVASSARPDFAKEFAFFHTMVKANPFVSSKGYTSATSAVMYCAGPAELDGDARKAAGMLQGLAVHVNSFPFGI